MAYILHLSRHGVILIHDDINILPSDDESKSSASARADADPQTLSLQPSSFSHSSTAVIARSGAEFVSEHRPSLGSPYSIGPLRPYLTNSIPVAMAANSLDGDVIASICENGINIVLWARVGAICHREGTRLRRREYPSSEGPAQGFHSLRFHEAFSLFARLVCLHLAT